MLLSLPKEQGLDVLVKSPLLRSLVQEYVQDIPVSQRGRRDIVMLQVLMSESDAQLTTEAS